VNNFNNEDLKQLDQNTLDWLYGRVGKATSSNFSKINTKPRKTDILVKCIPGEYEFGRAKKQQDEYFRLLEWRGREAKNSEFKMSDSILKSLKDRGAIKTTDVYDNELSTTAESFMLTMLSELANAEPYEFDGKAIKHGNTYEPSARSAYEFANDCEVKLQGLALLSDIYLDFPEGKLIGASVDGLVGDDGLIEIKCPLNNARHLRCFTSQEVPKEHMDQIQGQLWITDRQWCDFVSYNPFMLMDNRHLQMFVKRVPRDENYIGYLSDRVIKFVKLFIEKRDALKLPESLIS